MQNHLSSVSAKLAAYNCLADNTVTVLIIVSCLHFVFLLFLNGQSLV